MPGSLPVPDPINNSLDCTAPTTSAAITIDKTDISTGPYTLGDIITYQISLSNTGGENLFNTTLVDTLSPINIIDDPLGLISGNACLNANWRTYITYDYVVTDADVTAGTISNTATLSSPLLSASATHELFDVFSPGVISGSKVETSTGPYTVGDTVSFQVSVSNIGGSTVRNVNLSDSLSPINLISDPLLILSQGITLQPLSSTSVLYDYVVTESDVTTGTISNSACIISDLGEICYTSYVNEDNLVELGELVVIKTENSSGPYVKGDAISYQVDVTNIGGSDVTNIILYDSLPNITFTSDVSGLSAGGVTLSPNASAAVMYSYITTNENVAIGSVTNTASVVSDIGTTFSNTLVTELSGFPDQFIFIIDTRLTGTGSTENNEFQLPLINSGVYDFFIDWGDNTSDTITQWDDPNTQHTYSTGNIYTITITGTIRGWRFNGGGDALKYLNTIEWSGLTLATDSAFYGCENYTGSISAVGVPTLSSSSLNQCFKGCTIFNGDISNWDISNVNSLVSMLSGAVVYSSINYDNILISWAALPTVQPNVQFTNTYSTRTSAADTAYNTLTGAPNNWIIN